MSRNMKENVQIVVLAAVLVFIILFFGSHFHVIGTKYSDGLGPTVTVDSTVLHYPKHHTFYNNADEVSVVWED